MNRRVWKIVVVAVLAVALIVVSLVFVPKVNGLKCELVDTREDLATCQEDLATSQGNLTACQEDLTACQEDLTTCQEDLATCQEDLTTCQEDKKELEESLAEALGESLPTKAEVESLLRAKFDICRTVTTDALREAFPNLPIDLQPLTDRGEDGSCFIQVTVREGKFFVVGTKLFPLIPVE